MEMSRTLIIAEHDGTTLNTSTAKCVGCAAAIGAPVDVLVMGLNTGGVSAQAAILDGVERVLAVDAGHFAHPVAADWAGEIATIAADYSHVIGPSTTFGKDLMPRVAALLGVNQVSDIMSVEGLRQFTRPIYAGNAIINVECPDGLTIVATARVASWKAAGNNGSAQVESRAATSATAGHSRYIGTETAGGERPDLQSASIVVSGGRALASEENFNLIYGLADRLGAGAGASRAAVDAGYCPNDMQVGQTGKIIAPDLYFAFGISGAIQHVTGIKDAGTIVAVNKDADAPIFELSDIGLVGDLFSVIPEIETLLG
jgi:electron transfer flavoprotein alpha subunit